MDARTAPAGTGRPVAAVALVCALLVVGTTGCGDPGPGTTSGEPAPTDAPPAGATPAEAMPGEPLPADTMPGATPVEPLPADALAAQGWTRAGDPVDGLAVWFRPVDGSIPRNEPCALDVQVRLDGEPADDATFLIRADMPAHGHGLIREPLVEPTGPGAFRVESLLLHMRGEWLLEFEVLRERRSTVFEHRLEL